MQQSRKLRTPSSLTSTRFDKARVRSLVGPFFRNAKERSRRSEERFRRLALAINPPRRSYRYKIIDATLHIFHPWPFRSRFISPTRRAARRARIVSLVVTEEPQPRSLDEGQGERIFPLRPAPTKRKTSGRRQVTK